MAHFQKKTILIFKRSRFLVDRLRKLYSKNAPDRSVIWQHSHVAHGRGYEPEALLLTGLEVLHVDHVL